ncbi:MAG: queuosine salvage family protein [Solirubrobacteraceae bacterium]
MDDLRRACAQVAERARSVRVQTTVIPRYAAGLGLPPAPAGDASDTRGREAKAAFWLTVDAINFGSGWFPTLRKRDGRSGYHTIAAGLRDHFDAHGAWSPEELIGLDAGATAAAFAQDPAHELMELFAISLADLGRHVAEEHGGSFSAVIDAAHGSAVGLARLLGGWSCFADCSRYDELEVPFLKRAQIAAADLARAGVGQFSDVDRLTMFADNLVPHVLRQDGVLHFEPELIRRIDMGELIEQGSPEEVEIRACTVHAVELIVAARPGTRAADVDELLWTRGGEPVYKASPRHRSPCTAY